MYGFGFFGFMYWLEGLGFRVPRYELYGLSLRALGFDGLWASDLDVELNWMPRQLAMKLHQVANREGSKLEENMTISRASFVLSRTHIFGRFLPLDGLPFRSWGTFSNMAHGAMGFDRSCV